MPLYPVIVDEELAHGLLFGGNGLGELVKQVPARKTTVQ